MLFSITINTLQAQEFKDFQKNIRLKSIHSNESDPLLLKKDENTFIVDLFYKQQYNLFKDVNISEFSFTYNKQRSRLNLQASTDNTGPYINVNRIYGLYAVHVQIHKDKYMAAAISGGYINFSMGSNDQGGRFTDNTYDLKMGLSFYSDKTYSTIYYSQFLNQELQPYKDKYILDDEINVFLKQSIFKGTEFHYYGISLASLNLKVWNEIFAGGSVQYNNTVSMGSCISNLGNANIDLAVRLAFAKKYTMSIHTAYEFQTGLFKGRGDVSTIQFGIILKK